MQERLQKLISQAGHASRRKAEELITQGQVTVNGQIVTELGSKADWQSDRIAVAGKPLRPARQLHYLLFYKPKGVVTTLQDPEGRPAISDYLRGIGDRLYPVGRLDFHSEGLLLLTNDGDLANRVLHASTELPKTYWVKVSGKPTEEHLERLRRGVMIDGRRTAPARIRWLRQSAASGRERQRAGVYRTSEDNPWLEVVLVEGRYHQIRKMFQIVGHPVEKLKRVAIGPLTIGQLRSGQMRPLSETEIAGLRRGARRAPVAAAAGFLPGPDPLPRPRRHRGTGPPGRDSSRSARSADHHVAEGEPANAAARKALAPRGGNGRRRGRSPRQGSVPASSS